jgi:uncharacterized protein
MANSQTSVSAPQQRAQASLRVLNVPARPAPFKFEAPVAARISFWNVAGALFIVAAAITFLAMLGTPAGTAMGLSFVSVVLEALPFVVLGSLVSGLVEVFVPREWVVRLVPERKLFGILVAASLGLLIPVCECAVIPFTRRLVKKGIPFSTAVAYMLAGPTVNVLTGWSTLMAYGWSVHVLAARMIFGYFIAVAVALVVDRFFPGHSALIDPSLSSADSHDHDHDCGCEHDHEHEHHHEEAHQHEHDHHHDHEGCCHDHDHGHEHHHEHEHAHEHAHAHPKSGPTVFKRLADATNHAADDFLQVGQFLVIGAFVAAICQTVIPRQAILAMSHAPAVGIVLMMGLAVALNLCSGANAFVASSFRATMPLAAQMGFMLVGPMLDLKLSAMYLSFIRKRAFIVLMVLVYGIVLASMIVWQLFFVGGLK